MTFTLTARIVTIKIPVEQIRDVIGPCGKIIRSIVERDKAYMGRVERDDGRHVGHRRLHRQARCCACRSRDGGTVGHLTRAVTFAATVAIACAASVGRVDVLAQGAAQGADMSCGTVKTAAFADPEALAREYLTRMNDGQFLSRWEDVDGGEHATYTPWLRSAVLCPARLPPIAYPFVAPAIIVARYSAGPVKRSGDTATVSVSYDEVGFLEKGVFTPRRRTEAIDIALQLTPWGWRIAKPEDTQRVSAPAAGSRIHLSTATQQQLAAAVKGG